MTVRAEHRDGIARVELPGGPLDPASLDALRSAAARVADDATIGLWLLSHAGEDFCTGYDLGWFGAQPPDARRRFVRRSRELLAGLLELPVPSLVRLRGPAVGFGVLLARAHDRVWLEGPRARLRLPEVDRGVPIRGGLMELLRSRVEAPGLHRALVSGAAIGGPEAVAAGFADRWVARPSPGAGEALAALRRRDPAGLPARRALADRPGLCAALGGGRGGSLASSDGSSNNARSG